MKYGHEELMKLVEETQEAGVLPEQGKINVYSVCSGTMEYGDVAYCYGYAFSFDYLTENGYNIEGMCAAWEKCLVTFEPENAGVYDPKN